MILLDIMEKGRFLCQLRYTGKPFPRFIDGKVVPTYDSRDLERFVYEKRPSLKGKDIRIEFSDQRVITTEYTQRIRL